MTGAERTADPPAGRGPNSPRAALGGLLALNAAFALGLAVPALSVGLVVGNADAFGMAGCLLTAAAALFPAAACWLLVLPVAAAARTRLEAWGVAVAAAAVEVWLLGTALGGPGRGSAAADVLLPGGWAAGLAGQEPGSAVWLGGLAAQLAAGLWLLGWIGRGVGASRPAR